MKNAINRAGIAVVSMILGIGLVGTVYAFNAGDIIFNKIDTDGTTVLQQAVTEPAGTSVLVYRPGSGDFGAYSLGEGLEFNNFAKQLGLFDVPQSAIKNLASDYISTSTYNSLLSTVSGINSLVSGHDSTVKDVVGNIFGTSTSMLAGASSSKMGFISNTDVSSLHSLSSAMSTSGATVTLGTSRTIATSSAATGWQLSSTKFSNGNYSAKLTSTASIVSGQEGYVVVETSATNSTNPANWSIACYVTGNGQTYSLAIALQGVQPVYGSCTAPVPAGYYVRLREVNVTGAPTYSWLASAETVFPF